MSESSLKPRLVLVTRPTELQGLTKRFSTKGQIEFYLTSRAQSLAATSARDNAQHSAEDRVAAAVPADWSFAHVEREDLDRFLFFPNDIVVALGQDGLVANLAKYLTDQPVIGVAPDSGLSEGILTPHRVSEVPRLIEAVAMGTARISARTMVQAKTTAGETLTALNEIFVGHRSHQSARYEVIHSGKQEFQSSSGLIIASGTGLSGWARSIQSAIRTEFAIAADEPAAVFFVREAWPSRMTGATLIHGQVSAIQPLRLRSRIDAGGVIFADGIEADFLKFDWGEEADVVISDRRLRLVAGPEARASSQTNLQGVPRTGTRRKR
jgi:NAD kinase